MLSDIEYEVIEIGGSGNFNSIGQLIYHKSQLHQSIPVIAITDRDFRTQEKIEQISSKLDSNLIRDKSVRIIYWKRHEWENFLLEETETIANLFNQISTKKTGEKKTYCSRNWYNAKTLFSTSCKFDRNRIEFRYNN